jgi:hypothetical protein
MDSTKTSNGLSPPMKVGSIMCWGARLRGVNVSEIRGSVQLNPAIHRSVPELTRSPIIAPNVSVSWPTGRCSTRTSDNDSCLTMRQGRRRDREDSPNSCQGRRADLADCHRDRASTSRVRGDSNTNCGPAKRGNASRDRKAMRPARPRDRVGCANWSPAHPLDPVDCCDDARATHSLAPPSRRPRALISRRTFGHVSFRFYSRSTTPSRIFLNGSIAIYGRRPLVEWRDSVGQYRSAAYGFTSASRILPQNSRE